MMEQEAVAELKTFPVNCLDFKEQMALNMAIEALEKQIPKIPLRIPTDDTCLYYELRCPTCDAYMSGVIEMHHCKCGQTLDWK